MYFKFWSTFAILLLLHNFGLSNSANILAIAFVGSKSHRITYAPLLYELGKRGHNVTIASYTKSTKVRKNVREILTVDADDILKAFPSFYEMKSRGEEISPSSVFRQYVSVCEASYDVPEFRALLNEKFDLIFVEMMNDCALGMVYKLKPEVLVIVSTVSVPSFVAAVLGTPSPPSFIPGTFGRLTDRMTFVERISNFIGETIIRLSMAYQFNPAMEEVYRRKLNDSSIPSADDITRTASMIFSVSHFSVGHPRPLLPDIVELGGMHLHPPNPLSDSLATFADNSGPEGFIFFSLGSAMQGSEMPEEKRLIFLRVFAKLKQRVFWKWETETMANASPNIKLSKWLPQQDILGHPKCKLFITHGGLGGTTEAIYHGVPMVGIPMFGDQLLNMAKSERSGYAVSIDYNRLTEEVLSAAINQVLTQPSYAEKIRRLSKIYRDQQDHPLDRGVFWTEYLLRHKGAPHLRSPARDLNFFQYHSLDVIFALVGILFVIVYLTFTICRLLNRQLRKVFVKSVPVSTNNKNSGIAAKKRN